MKDMSDGEGGGGKVAEKLCGLNICVYALSCFLF